MKIQPYIQGYEVRESKPLSVTEKLILFTPLEEYVVGMLVEVLVLQVLGPEFDSQNPHKKAGYGVVH